MVRESVDETPMVREFVYEALPMRVRFGSGTRREIGAEVEHLGLTKVLVLSTPEQQELAKEVSDALGRLSVGVHPGAVMHVPVETAQEACRIATDRGADGCVAVGGGSTVGLGKAIARDYGLPIIALPTTYAGSEMTPVWGMTEGGVKTTGKDAKVLPRSVVYDPDLTMTLPVGMSVTSGFNAIAHAVEGLYAPDRSPIISLMALDGVRALASALPAIVDDPQDAEARADALYGAWLCGAVLGATTMSLHHKLCHTLGGTGGLPHAETHTVVLPYALAVNQEGAPEARAALEQVLDTDNPARRLQQLARQLGAPTSLRALGLDPARRERIVEVASSNPYANPVDVTPELIGDLVDQAYTGTPL